MLSKLVNIPVVSRSGIDCDLQSSCDMTKFQTSNFLTEFTVILIAHEDTFNLNRYITLLMEVTILNSRDVPVVTSVQECNSLNYSELHLVNILEHLAGV